MNRLIGPVTLDGASSRWASTQVAWAEPSAVIASLDLMMPSQNRQVGSTSVPIPSVSHATDTSSRDDSSLGEPSGQSELEGFEDRQHSGSVAVNDDIRGPAEVIRAMVSMFDTGQVDQVAEIVDADYFDHQDRVSGPAGFEKVVAGARSRYATLDVTVEDLIEATDRVAVRLRWLGTRPSGQVDERETIDIVRIANGRAIEHWGGRS